ncbi:MAG TPA: enoyl-CoA hydratase/isomerase family protein [Galbitalea sp.]|jgi:enoyl-CoA hydratase|nr:enoyl-CoA hydratase/isomerase family protein [Galbitalea sp.]
MTMELECWRWDTVDEHIAVLTFDRPPVNAQNRRSREELLWLLDLISDRDDIHVVVLTGAGKIFSAGADIKERVTISTEDGDYRAHNRITRDFFYAPTDCTKPVIGAINGAAIGAGYALAAGCDILIAAESAYIQLPEIDRGLLGGAKFLEQHFPRTVARLIFYTGRKVNAEAMYRYGMVVDVVPDDQLLESALTIAREIAAKQPTVIQKAKATFNTAESMPFREGYVYEQTQTRELASSDATRQAQQDFLDKKIR